MLIPGLAGKLICSRYLVYAHTSGIMGDGVPVEPESAQQTHRPAPPIRLLRSLALPLLLALVFAVAAYVRISGHDWDQGYGAHVDETAMVRVVESPERWVGDISLATLLDPQRSPLNQRRGDFYYSYGTLPLYLLKGVVSLTHTLIGDSAVENFDGIEQTGRIMSALMDALTVLVVFAVGTRLWGSWVGLFCATLYTFAVLPIQTAHFLGQEVALTLFATCGLLASVVLAQTGKRRYALLAGLGIGLAMACKLSAAPLLVLPVGGALAWHLNRNPDQLGTCKRAVWGRVALLLGLALVGAFVGLLAADPYAILNHQRYLDQVQFETQVQSGVVDAIQTRKYVGTSPLYPWGQLILLGVNPLVGIVGTVGLLAAIWRGWRERLYVEFLLPLGAIAYFIPIAAVEARWVRYLLPLVPFLVLLAGALVARLWGYGRSHGWLRKGLLISCGALILSAIVCTLAFRNIYSSEHTYVQASRWIYDNVPEGSRIGSMWPEWPLPVSIRGKPANVGYFEMSKYDIVADATSKQVYFALREYLKSVDYLTLNGIATNRTIFAMPWRYPVQGQFYRLLLSEQLGFKLVYQSTSYPSFLGAQVPDDRPPFDPSFVEYD
ncbi:MAG: glycosyltransferase family 39 protein, partial [Chloroflexota bacterium]|nr:glycosyltransferase family 39 protein [Chloroflexota bacterium]